MSDTYKWRKSSYSTVQSNCVEVARNLPGTVAVRDSRDPSGPVLTITPAGWRTFVETLKER